MFLLDGIDFLKLKPSLKLDYEHVGFGIHIWAQAKQRRHFVAINDSHSPTGLNLEITPRGLCVIEIWRPASQAIHGPNPYIIALAP